MATKKKKKLGKHNNRTPKLRAKRRRLAKK